MAKKKNKFDKIQVNENYIAPENQGKTETFDAVSEKQEIQSETPAEQYHDRKVSKTGAGVFSFKKVYPKEKRERVKVSLPNGVIAPHILMVSVLVMCVLGMLVADSSFYDEFSGASLYAAYAATNAVIYLVPCAVYMLIVKKKPDKVNIRGFEAGHISFAFVSLVLLLCMTSLIKYYIAYTFSYRTVESLPAQMDTLGIVIVTALVPAICEEVFVHGVLQSEYSRFGGGVSGIMVSAIVFALIHFDLQYFAVYLAAGLVLGVVTHITGSVFAAMLLHLVNNLVAVFLSDNMTFIASERIGGAFLMIVLTIFVLVLLIIQLQMIERICRVRAIKLSSEGEGEDIQQSKHTLFICPDGATSRRLVRLLFSPAVIAAIVIFAVVV